MWLIADSGSTKTEWILFDSKEKKKLLTSGLNPLFLSGSDFKAKLKTSIPQDWANEVTKFWFYGAGCGTDKIKESTTRWLKTIFTKADIQVNTDLIAAARATCGTNKGMVAILGTGSNSCYYDGFNIISHVKPLGFILGDEGSGAALGKSLLTNLLRKQLPEKLTDSIYQDIGMSYGEIIERVYRSEWPSRFIASIARLIYKHMNEPEVEVIIRNEFDRFSNILLSYNIKTEVNFVGSVAFYLESHLRESLTRNGLKVGEILKSPTEALVNYHLINS
jgi:N-acetylglucosamine kinase-like BadF-type ATPase